MILLPDDHRFTFSEVVGESSYDTMNLRNWMARDVIHVGQKHKLGRWLFSITDIVRIKIIQSLTKLAGMPPADANSLADQVVARYLELVTPDKDGRFPLLYRLKPNSLTGRKRLCLRAGIEGRDVMLGTVNTHGVLEFDEDFGGTKFTFDQVMGSCPHLVIPMDELIAQTVMNYTIMAVEEDGGDWIAPAFAGDPSDKNYDPYAAAVSVEGMLHWYSQHAARTSAVEHGDD